MLLKKLIESPKTSSKLLVYDPFAELDQEELVMEVIGLANADVEGPRNILFGINAGAMEGGGIVGISEDAVADLKKAHRLVSSMIEPVLHLAFIFDRINGKLVGALEIDGCDDGPYIVGQNHSEKLSRGQCWVRQERKLVSINPAELARPGQQEAASKTAKPGKRAKPPPILVGFNDQPDCQFVELAVPDSSNPPFAGEKRKSRQPRDLAERIKEKIETITTQILRIGGARKQDQNAESSEGSDTQTGDTKFTDELLDAADNHYFFEEKAIKLNLCLCNKGTDSVDKVSIKLGFPCHPDFNVADKLYISPFDKRSQYEVKKLGYPEVLRLDDAIVVRNTLDVLPAGEPEPAFKCALRLAVGPKMRGKKIAIVYSLRGPDKQNFGEGRLKIKFSRSPA